MLNPKMVVIHHSKTSDSDSLSWAAIHNYHVNTMGWSDIGYHAGIEEVDGRYVCLFGRPDMVPGAHTAGYNGSTLGFCFVGDYDESEPGEARLRVAARRVLAPWLLRHGLGVDALVPHNQFAAKTCPGKRFPMDRLRTIVRQEMENIRG